MTQQAKCKVHEHSLTEGQICSLFVGDSRVRDTDIKKLLADDSCKTCFDQNGKFKFEKLLIRPGTPSNANNANKQNSRRSKVQNSEKTTLLTKDSVPVPDNIAAAAALVDSFKSLGKDAQEFLAQNWNELLNKQAEIKIECNGDDISKPFDKCDISIGNKTMTFDNVNRQTITAIQKKHPNLFRVKTTTEFGGGAAPRSKYTKTKRTHTSRDGVKRVIYERNGMSYVKRKDKKTGKFVFRRANALHPSMP